MRDSPPDARHLGRPQVRPGKQRALWVSTSLSTHGGIATFVRNMQQTELWRDWNIRHVATHCNGSVPARLRKFASGLARFMYELVVHRPAVVHIHMSSYGSFARKCLLTWISVLFRVPVVLHIHGSEFHQFFEASPPRVKRIIRATLERAYTVIALGETWASRLRSMAPSSDIMIVPNAIRPAAAVAQLSSGPVHVVFLGEVCPRKGTFLLLEAWAKLSSDSPAKLATLTIAGDGEVDRARDVVDSLEIQESVDIRGWLSATEVQQLLATTQVLVLPSLSEGQPMAILEAMARGICVVASRSGGIPEMLADASGLLVDPLEADTLADALLHVIIDDAARAQFGASARLRVERHFDVDQISRKFDDLYRHLVRGCARGDGSLRRSYFRHRAWHSALQLRTFGGDR